MLWLWNSDNLTKYPENRIEIFISDRGVHSTHVNTH